MGDVSGVSIAGLNITVGSGQILCPYCGYEKLMVPSSYSVAGYERETGQPLLVLQFECKKEDGGCGEELGFVAEVVSPDEAENSGRFEIL